MVALAASLLIAARGVKGGGMWRLSMKAAGVTSCCRERERERDASLSFPLHKGGGVEFLVSAAACFLLK